MLTKEQVEKIYELSSQYEDGVNVQKGESELNYILRNMNNNNNLEQAYTNLCKYVEQTYGESCAELYQRFLDEENKE